MVLLLADACNGGILLSEFQSVKTKVPKCHFDTLEFCTKKMHNTPKASVVRIEAQRFLSVMGLNVCASVPVGHMGYAFK